MAYKGLLYSFFCMLMMACSQVFIPSSKVPVLKDKTLAEIKAEVRNLPENIEKQNIKNSPYTQKLAFYVKREIQLSAESELFSSPVLDPFPSIFTAFQKTDRDYEKVVETAFDHYGLTLTPDYTTAIVDYFKYLKSQDYRMWPLFQQEVQALLMQERSDAGKTDEEWRTGFSVYISPQLMPEQQIDASQFNFEGMPLLPCPGGSDYRVNEVGSKQRLDSDNHYATVINTNTYLLSFVFRCGGYSMSNQLESFSSYTSFYQEGKKVTFTHPALAFAEGESGLEHQLLMNLCFNSQQQKIDYIEHFAVVRLFGKGEFITPVLRLVIDRDRACSP